MWEPSVISLVVVLALLFASLPVAKAQILNIRQAKNFRVASGLAGTAFPTVHQLPCLA
jgi:hypothetical protein